MDRKTADLDCVWQGEESWAANAGRVTAIVLANDGCGPMGHYDRIHIVFEDGELITLPAHQCSGWSSSVCPDPDLPESV